MPANEVSRKKEESFKDQPAAAELEHKTEELSAEEAAKIGGGGQPPTINYHP